MSDKDLKDFMKKKNAEARGEIQVETAVEEEKLADAPKSINQEAGQENIRAAKALAMFRLMLNMLFIIPLTLVALGLISYILLSFLPSALNFIKKLFFMILTK